MGKHKFITGRWSLKGGSEEPSEPGMKRKEQLRRAQENYRRRKEGYVKSLEGEVVHLRTCRSDLLGETRKLTAEIEWLRDIIDRHNIILPPTPEPLASAIQQPAPTSSSITTVYVNTDHLNNKRLIVQIDGPSVEEAPSSIHHRNHCCHAPPGGSTAPDFLFTAPPESSHDANVTNSCHQSPWINQSEVAVGMNFILSLEGPCLEHVKAARETPDAPNGHALTLTASIFRLYGESSLPPEEDQLLKVSRKTLERLLELSSQLAVEDELTPTQVWAFICQSPWAVDARPDQIMSIAQGLLSHVTCYGYGSVIPRDVVMNAVAQAFQIPS